MKRAISPVVTEQLITELLASDLLHIDETAWKEAGKLVWLWAFVSTYTVVYQIGKRHRLVVQHLLGNLFNDFIMTDGFSVYRIFPKRLRCWAHLIRKARALHQSLDLGDQDFGSNLLLVLTSVVVSLLYLRAS
ncbi:MAG: transposase [Methylovulum sp.]|nr:transposase [Methylovulum sp.]MCF7997571.1 transposase [Methylovulum sp.]